MRFLASIILLVTIAMSPAMMDAFGQIAKLEIISGIIDLQENEQIIKCTGRKNGGLYEGSLSVGQWVSRAHPLYLGGN